MSNERNVEQSPTDIDEMRRHIALLEEEVRASKSGQTLLRAVLDNAPDFVSQIEPDGTFLFMNRLVAGSPHGDVVGRNIFEFVPAEWHAPLRECFERVVRSQRPDQVEAVASGGPGRSARYLTRVAPVIEDGRVVALTLISTDVTRLVETEGALRETQEKLGLALAATGIGLWSWDRATDLVVCDDATCRIFGIAPSDAPLTREAFLACIHPADRARVASLVLRRVETGVFEEQEYRVQWPDGTTRWVLAKGSVIGDDSGGAIRFFGGVLDLTERRHLEDQLRQAQKIEAIGALAAGIAHNFNNMLAGILPNVERAMEMAAPEAAAMLKTARDAARRAAKLVRDLMLFSGNSRPRGRQVEDLNVIVERVVDICRTTFDRAIRIEIEGSAEAATVEVDAGQIEQAILNVLINARDALERVSDRPRQLGGAPAPRCLRIRIDREADGSDTVRLRIADNGIGMDEQTRRRMFEPFFTTKEVGRGTGLGLATTYAIVREHRGRIACESTPDVGTMFSIYLPLSAHARIAPSEPRPTEPVRGGRERILVVDDETLVRTSVMQLLSMAAYETLGAPDGQAALEILRERHAEIDLVILDQSMPRLSGRGLLDALEPIAPRLKVIGFSGLGATHDRRFVATLDKPADAETILRTVRAALDGDHEPASG